ncbi:MAG: hypothetical protein V7717_00780 [Porticoccaceae bacterium]
MNTLNRSTVATAFKTGLGVCCLLLAGFALAADDLQVTITSQKEILEVNEQGEQVARRVPVDVAVPGDEIIYTVAVNNSGAVEADNVVVTDPVPAEMAYIESSVFGPIGGMSVTYSADGGVSYLPRGDLIVVIASGEVRQASPADITHIRWQLKSPLLAGTAVQLGYRAKVR